MSSCCSSQGGAQGTRRQSYPQQNPYQASNAGTRRHSYPQQNPYQVSNAGTRRQSTQQNPYQVSNAGARRQNNPEHNPFQAAIAEARRQSNLGPHPFLASIARARQRQESSFGQNPHPQAFANARRQSNIRQTPYPEAVAGPLRANAGATPRYSGANSHYTPEFEKDDNRSFHTASGNYGSSTSSSGAYGTPTGHPAFSGKSRTITINNTEDGLCISSYVTPSTRNDPHGYYTQPLKPTRLSFVSDDENSLKNDEEEPQGSEEGYGEPYRYFGDDAKKRLKLHKDWPRPEKRKYFDDDRKKGLKLPKDWPQSEKYKNLDKEAKKRPKVDNDSPRRSDVSESYLYFNKAAEVRLGLEHWPRPSQSGNGQIYQNVDEEAPIRRRHNGDTRFNLEDDISQRIHNLNSNPQVNITFYPRSGAISMNIPANPTCP